jgi:IclR family acetate operon transcriptional repressor
MKPNGGRSTHQSLGRGLQVLEAVASSGGKASLTEAARRTALHRSTTHHLLQQLVNFGYLRQDAQTRCYELTSKLFRLTARTWTPEQIGLMTEPVAAELTARIGEGTSVAAYCDSTVMIVAKCDPNNPLRVVQDVGAARPIHATAVGKAIVAFLPSRERAAVAGRLKYDRYTPHTIASRSGFEAELRRIQAQGYAIDDEEHHLGVRCIAAPIFSYTGHAIGCLCIVGPKARMTRQRLRDLREPILDYAESLSTRFGWTDAATVAIQ